MYKVALVPLGDFVFFLAQFTTFGLSASFVLLQGVGCKERTRKGEERGAERWRRGQEGNRKHEAMSLRTGPP